MSRGPAALAAALGCIIAFARADPVVLVDDRSVAMRLPAPAARIVTLAPHLAEIVHAAGAGEKLVGVALHSDFPESVQPLPRVGDAGRVHLESILLLKPDLVLAWKSGNQAADIARLEQLGLAVFVSEPARLSDISRVIRGVGALAGTRTVAERAAAAFESEIEGLRTRYSKKTALRVFYEIWHRPLLTVSGAHMISDVLRMCGGVNVFADLPLLTPTVSLEALLAAGPEVIVGGGSAVDARKFAQQWQGSAVPALREIPLVHVPPDEIQRATPRIAAGARTICAGLERVRATRP
ncbi:MAG: cobalamin-binding protein [Betaproteobacteria bacterium]